MLASRITLLHLYHIYIPTTTPSPRPSTMWFMSPVLRWNFLPLGAVLTKLQIVMVFPRSLLPILSMQPKKSLTLLHIPSKFTLWLYSANFKNSSYNIKTILSNFENVPVALTDLSIKQLTKIQRPSILFCYCLAKHHGTLARKAKVMIYWTFGKWHSKLRTSKESNSLIYLMTITTSLNHLMPKKDLSSKSLVTQTLCTYMLREH